jgi:predicted nuclease of predicted toxin-antitoxin system
VRLLIDENVPRSVANLFVERGHEVIHVRDQLLPGTPDPVVAAVGDSMNAIVVTWNRSDFRSLASRFSTLSGRQLRNLGLIVFRCNEAQGRRRLEQFIDLVEFEYELCQQRNDRRLIVEIGKSYFKVQR